MPNPSCLLVPEVGQMRVVSRNLAWSPVRLAMSNQVQVHGANLGAPELGLRPQYHGVVPTQALIDHLKENALRTDGPFTLRSGATSSWYLDGRQVTFDGEGAWVVGRAFYEALGPDVEAVGGMTMGADPIAMAIAMVAAADGKPLRAFSIRKEAKGHGTGGRVVGPVGTGTRVALVEDTTTTGSATLEAAEASVDAGLVIEQVIVMVDRSDGVAEERLDYLGVPYQALVVPADLGVDG